MANRPRSSPASLCSESHRLPAHRMMIRPPNQPLGVTRSGLSRCQFSQSSRADHTALFTGGERNITSEGEGAPKASLNTGDRTHRPIRRTDYRLFDPLSIEYLLGTTSHLYPVTSNCAPSAVVKTCTLHLPGTNHKPDSTEYLTYQYLDFDLKHIPSYFTEYSLLRFSTCFGPIMTGSGLSDETRYRNGAQAS
ncbi:uncharacterized protein BP01DRAFT_232766 [Aspergillus saccharolyticus JOP 1030-1]|uniref:Uncharacterized protein n=1 Tax=Aspergillus saccharolyticus JOP 1030-1 TaxID=1450539 RepID=A0A318Z178_9EURO|nr:hypothetical protein BP01DRAFT_232766 [Aspergillus saccharolyticus JOP 1030-1]PYH40134.1 hypothetical protein BP01DRAFT_232766 [Aspergillus saccharolyticus JOP 1030-1]